jgi:hypothetical protein
MSSGTPSTSIRCYLTALLALGALMLTAPRLAAQTAPVTGVPPLSTVQSLPEGTLNLGDLNLHVAVPIVNKAGRGTPVTYTLGFDSDVWTPVTNGTWTPAFNWGWTTETDAFTGYVTYQASPQQCAYGNSYPPQMYNFTLYENFIYYDQFGAAHLINMEPLQYPDLPPVTGPGMRMTVPPFRLVLCGR